MVLAPSGPIPSPAPIPPTSPQPLPPPLGTATDIKTFVAAKKPKSDIQFATTVAYYYRFESPPATRQISINGEVLQEAARLAGRARLANPRNTLNNAKGQGYLDSDSPGSFSINSVGENLVAMTLPGNSDAGVKAKKKAKAKNKK
jgi:hypothetical protein